MTVNQYEVDQENFAGRLHPSQRRNAVGGISIGVVFTALGIWLLILAFTTVGVSVPKLPYLLPEVALLVWGLWLTIRRVLDLASGRVAAITGWTGEMVDQSIAPVGRHTEYGKAVLLNQAQRRYVVRVHDRRFNVRKDLFDRVSANCTNTAFVTPHTKRLLNIARTPT